MPSSRGNQNLSPVRNHPHLYEIDTWAWLEELSARYGRSINLGTVPSQEWDKLQQLSFDFVWLMGVWKRSAEGRRITRTHPDFFASYDAALPNWTMEDVTGSPYSVQGYVPDPRIGNENDLDAARSELHARGIRLILDFVTNHTAPDHPWVASHPEYYVQGTLADFRKEPSAFYLVESNGRARFIARGRDPYFPPWPDTAQLNYYNPALREAMLDALREIAQHCDGVRCDMAMLSLNDIFARTWGPLLSGFRVPRDEFWPAAVSTLPGFTWIAEVYWDLERRLQRLGLNFTYDKRFYDRLLDAAPQEVRVHLEADSGYQVRCVRFLENHDEKRSAQVFGKDRLPAAATLLATAPGMRFYYHGQLEGRKLYLPNPLRRTADEAPDPEIQALYSRLLSITREDVFRQGDWRLLEVRPAGDGSFENLIAYQWRDENALKVIAANLGSASSQGSIALGEEIDPIRRYRLTDQLNGRNFDWQGQDIARGGLFVRLEPFRSHIFNVQTAS
ncbi:MAG TPA: alpha-amylase family glycosyl hydrolase [Terriglobia bacterium]|nr:alpha-amylase family glycosyl hydrolase [Terriglobia bacterium]